MKKLLFPIAAGALSLCAFTASADIYTVDWEVDGDQRAILDTESDLAWLTLKETINLSFAEAGARMTEGGVFDGWRFATAEEVHTLFYNVFPDRYDYGVATYPHVDLRTIGFEEAALDMWFANMESGSGPGYASYAGYFMRDNGKYDSAGFSSVYSGTYDGHFQSPDYSRDMDGITPNNYYGLYLVTDVRDENSAIEISKDMNAQLYQKTQTDVSVSGISVAGLLLMGTAWRQRRGRAGKLTSR